MGGESAARRNRTGHIAAQRKTTDAKQRHIGIARQPKRQANQNGQAAENPKNALAMADHTSELNRVVLPIVAAAFARAVRHQPRMNQ